MKVVVKFGDSRSNRSRNIRLPHFVTNNDDDNNNGNDNQADGPNDNGAKRR